MTKPLLFLFLFTCLMGVINCGSRENPTQVMTFIASVEDGVPLQGVTVHLNGKAIGTTGPKGELKYAVTAPEGTEVEMRSQCPEGYRNLQQKRKIKLRSVQVIEQQNRNRGTEIPISCPPEKHLAIVIVRTNENLDLPIVLDGQREVARTGALGITHLALYMKPNTTFGVKIDTSQHPDLTPESPISTFSLGESDDIFAVDYKFTTPVVQMPVVTKKHLIWRKPKPTVKPTTVKPVRPEPTGPNIERIGPTRNH